MFNDAALTRHNDLALLIGRILVGLLFVIAAYNKATAFGGSTAYFTRLGIPAPSLVVMLSIAFELVAGLLLIAGYCTRWVALAIAVFCVVTALIAHTNLGDGNQLNHFLKNLAIAGGCLGLMVAGAGAHAMDARK